MTSPLNSDAPDDLRSLMNQDHLRLDRLFERLNSALATNAASEFPQLWTVFEGGLTTHVELEERFILPKLAEIAPGEAARLARDHAEIRSQLLQLGVALDLRLVRADAVHEFMRVLKSHAAREDGLMHRWADAHVVGPTRGTLLTSLIRVTRKGVGMAPRRVDAQSP